MSGVVIMDHRGRVCRIPPADLFEHLEGVDPVRRRELLKMRSQLTGGRLPVAVRVALAMVLGLGVGLATWKMTHAFLSSSDARASAGILAGMTAVLSGYMGWQLCVRLPGTRRHVSELEFLQNMDRCQLCLSCSYDLALVRVSPDNRVACPECGAAWFFYSRTLPAPEALCRRSWSTPHAIGRPAAISM